MVELKYFHLTAFILLFAVFAACDQGSITGRGLTMFFRALHIDIPNQLESVSADQDEILPLNGGFISAAPAQRVLGSRKSSADCKVGDHEFNKGEVYHPKGQCIELTCAGPDEFLEKGCGEFQSLKPCKYIPTDLSKPFPQCCPRFDC